MLTMKTAKFKLRAVWLTARRAGWRRSLWRLNRRLRLRLLNPYLGRRLYPLPQNLAPASWAEDSPVVACLTTLAQLRQTGPHAHAWNIEAETVALLNQPPVPLAAPVAWQARPIDDPLWSFQLHGWEWAWPVLTNAAQRAAVWALWQDWLAQNPIGRGLAWEPYPTSRRIVVWLAAWGLLKGDGRFALAIAQQANYLRHHLERDLDNNHLIANAKALAWAGLLLPDLPQANRWRSLGLKWLWQSLLEQVRPDGGHVENSSSYHLAVWQDGLETALLCEACNEAVPDAVWDVLQRMGEFAWALRRPDGRLPLLNDSIEDEPLPSAAIFALADKTLEQANFISRTGGAVAPHGYEAHVFKDTGYAVIRYRPENNGTYLFFDAGDLGPAHCPGHGHADTLSFELWSQGEALIVDPGTYQYPAGKWRGYFRGTAVHSTATIDGLNQSSFAGPFRLADMAQGHLLSAALNQPEPEIMGEHNGYGRLADPVIHQRHIRFHNATHITITDLFTGSETHQIALFFHLSPSQTNLERKNVIQAVYPSGTQLKLQVNNNAAAGSLSATRGWMSRTWYSREPSPIIVFKAKAKLPVTITTQITISDKETLDG